MEKYLFFDHASTTPCSTAVGELLAQYACRDYGNPSSGHVYGQQAARAIREARKFFADHFNVEPVQVIFTGSGSEADNLAIYGVAMDAWARRKNKNSNAPLSPSPRILTSSIEHSAVKKTVESLNSLGFEAAFLPVGPDAQLRTETFRESLRPSTVLVSIQQVNNIVGSVFPVESLAEQVKSRVPQAVFHTDAIQAFGKIRVPTHPSAVDLVSISAHKIHGPKGVGALIVLNKKLLNSGLRPLIWGGGQEGGFRSGTQNPGLIAGFHLAAKEALEQHDSNNQAVSALRIQFQQLLRERNLLTDEPAKSPVHWNSPASAIPQVVSLSIPGFPAGPLARLLEEQGCLVSTGSACSSQKSEPEPVLFAMGLPPNICNSAIRISFSSRNKGDHVKTLVHVLDESIQRMRQLLEGGRSR